MYTVRFNNRRNGAQEILKFSKSKLFYSKNYFRINYLNNVVGDSSMAMLNKFGVTVQVQKTKNKD